jgi:hypothetical protein
MYKWDVLSIQCNMRPGRSISTTETDGLCLIVIDLYVQMLTRRFH